MIQIKKTNVRGNGEAWTVTFRGLTLGQLLALRNALGSHGEQNGSVVAAELLALFEAAASEDLLQRMSR